VLATTVAVATFHFGWVLIAAAKSRLVHALFGNQQHTTAPCGA
jgi:hypothetical protein